MLRGISHFLLVGACLLLVGCQATERVTAPDVGGSDMTQGDDSQGDDDAATDSGEETDDNIFHGTPVEHTEAKAECYERLGVTVTPDPDDPTILTLDIGGVDDELMDELSEQCREEIGRVTPDSYPDGYLKRIHEHRLWQRECLIDLGHDLPAPPSFEEFLDTLETPDSFTPLGDTGLRGPDFLSAEEECPGLHQWEQQQGTLD